MALQMAYVTGCLKVWLMVQLRVFPKSLVERMIKIILLEQTDHGIVI